MSSSMPSPPADPAAPTRELLAPEEAAWIERLEPETEQLTALAARADRRPGLAQCREMYAVLFRHGLHRSQLTPKWGGSALGLGSRCAILEWLGGCDAGLAFALATTAS